MAAASDPHFDVVPRVGLVTLLRRALALRCPACGYTALYERPFVMRRTCATCGLVYEVEPGFFVGAIYVNYAVTVAFGLGLPLALEWWSPVSLTTQLALAVPLMLTIPVLFFHHARSLWLALNVFASGPGWRAAGRR